MSGWTTRAWVLTACLMLAACASAASVGEAPPTPPPAADSAAPPEPSRACQVDADCAVKNVGNCCGYFPACVHRDAPTFPEQVKAACARDGMSSICGFAEISACRCVENLCEAAPEGASEVQ